MVHFLGGYIIVQMGGNDHLETTKGKDMWRVLVFIYIWTTWNMLVFEATSSAEKETSNLCSLDV